MDIKYLRVVLGVTRREKLRNEIMGELGVDAIMTGLEEKKFKLFRHLCKWT